MKEQLNAFQDIKSYLSLDI